MWTRAQQTCWKCTTCFLIWNTNLSPMPSSKKSVYLSVSFSLFLPPPKPCMHFPSPPCVPDALSTNSPLFDHWNNILLPVNIITLHITQFSPTVYHFLPLRGKYLFTTLFSNNPQFYISVRSHTSHPYQATGKIIVVYSSEFTMVGKKHDKRFWNGY